MGFIFPRALAKYVSPLLASVRRRVNRLFLLFPFRVCLFSPVVVAVSVCLCARVSGFLSIRISNAQLLPLKIHNSPTHTRRSVIASSLLLFLSFVST